MSLGRVESATDGAEDLPRMTSYTIGGFRSIQSPILLDQLGPMNVLIGKNGAGKSNIFKSVEFVARFAVGLSNSPARISSWMADRAELPPMHSKIELIIGKSRIRYDLTLEGLGSKSNNLSIREKIEVMKFRGRWETLLSRSQDSATLQGGKTVSIGAPAGCLPAILSSTAEPSEWRHYAEALHRWLGGVSYRVFDVPSEVHTANAYIVSYLKYFFEDLQLSSRDGIEDDRDGVSACNKLVDLYLNDRETFDEIDRLVGKWGLQLVDEISVTSLQFRREGNDSEGAEGYNQIYVLEFKSKSFLSKNRMLNYKDLSAGTRQIINLITAVFYDKPPLMLIEHPEDGIHRGLARKLISLLRTNSGRSQFFITSHSETVLDALDPTEIRFVSMGERGTQVRRLTAREIKIAKEYLDEKGSLSDFVELVEGEL